jgi:RNA polymerase sigma-70 factor (ECF subfamily)
MITSTDATLVQQVLSGKRECYRPLVEKYQKKIYILACSILGNAAESQDIAQEAFLVAYNRLGELKDKNKFGSWLYGITRNLCYSARRKQLIAPESLEDLPTAEYEYSNVVSMHPAREEDGTDLLNTLLTRLDQLPEKYSTLLRLKYLQDYSYQEISEMLDMPVDLVRSRLFEGRRILREGVQPIRSEEHGS